MALDNTFTVRGQLTAEPELRHTKTNIPVASFTIAHNDRTFDKESGEWVDGDPTFVRCSYWREAGENFAESHEKGDRVIAFGSLKQNDFTDKDGNDRSNLELRVEEAGPSNKYATTTTTRRKGNGNKSSAPKSKAKANAGASSKAESSSEDADDDFDF
ncbi:single-stranded DNA-binding protein [Brachybacterium sacelli]|uniref:Single-stranded DNA-binding protein n=1 Tax=Brachybacterium sacelli TaxID=173364 RepID=A0ABS4X5Y3_9MICO|nr:single-stranded DNA-binding protein [Brachybacterium sacelli]MBP2383741.1 single-strand DNA-binding protein [Brachybacterium sacelli]